MTEKIIIADAIRATEAGAIAAARLMGRGDRMGGDPDAAVAVDIAVDPLEGTNLVATGEPNATAVLAAAEPGGLMHAPDTYLQKLIVGPGVAGKVDINDPVAKTLSTIA